MVDSVCFMLWCLTNRQAEGGSGLLMAVADTGEYTLSMKRGEGEETRKEGEWGGAVNNITEQQCYKIKLCLQLHTQMIIFTK